MHEPVDYLKTPPKDPYHGWVTLKGSNAFFQIIQSFEDASIVILVDGFLEADVFTDPDGLVTDAAKKISEPDVYDVALWRVEWNRISAFFTQEEIDEKQKSSMYYRTMTTTG